MMWEYYTEIVDPFANEQGWTNRMNELGRQGWEAFDTVWILEKKSYRIFFKRALHKSPAEKE